MRAEWYDVLTAINLHKAGYLTLEQLVKIVEGANRLDDYQAELVEKGKAREFSGMLTVKDSGYQCVRELDTPTADQCPNAGDCCHVIVHRGIDGFTLRLCEEHSAELTEAENQ